MASVSLKFEFSVTTGKKKRMDIGTASHSSILSCRIAEMQTKVRVTPGCTAQLMTTNWTTELAFGDIPVKA